MGEKYLSPNGKKSNLTPEQYKLVRTKAFKDWFGDWENNPSKASKVVDENGEPLVVYHSSSNEFNIFDQERTRNSIGYRNLLGFYFRANKLDEYGERINDKVFKNQMKEFGSIIKPYFLNIKSIVLTHRPNRYEPKNNYTDLLLSKEQIVKIIGDRKSESISNDKKEDFIKSLLNTRLIDEQIYPIYLNYFLNSDMSEFYDTTTRIGGFDGFEDIGNYVVFNSNQIKLADGTNTKFDGNNPDIRYKKGGYVTYKDKYNTKYGYKKSQSHTLEEISKDTGVSMKGLQQIYNKGIGAYKTNPQSVRPNVKSKEQWAMARVYSAVMGGKASKIDSNELKMENGGLIAPNGKKSNLTALQYKLVRTKAFKDWFGDWENDPENASKVVDENGEPLVVYHGTNSEFYQFDKNWESNTHGTSQGFQGFFFTKNKGRSGEYALSKEDRKGGDAIVVPAFLSLKNPNIKDAKNQSWLNVYPEQIDNAIDNKNDGVITYNLLDGANSFSYWNENADDNYVVFQPNQIKLADGTNTTFDGNNPDIRFNDGGRTLTKQEIESMQRAINDPLLSPKLKESFQKVLASRKVPTENIDFSRYPEGKYIDPYDFSGYEYMRSKNEEMGVSFLLTGEYELVSKAIFEKDYAMWLFYNYLGRINISFSNCLLWLKQAQAYFINTMPIQVALTHQPKAKDGRSYAMWFTTSDANKEKAESRLGVNLTFEYNGSWYCNEIGMVGNYDYKGTGWGTFYEERKTGLLVPEYTETSFHFNTLIHEFAHCLDFQSQLMDNIKKFKDKKAKIDSGEIVLNTEEMTDLEKELYGSSLKKKADSVTRPITNHFEYFIDALIKVLRACASGEIPLTQKFEQQALDVQTALSGVYGDLLIEQRERKRKEAMETKKIDELRENTRFTWQGRYITEVLDYVEKNAMQRELLESLSKRGVQRPFTLSEIIELDNLISQYANTDFRVFSAKNPSKSSQLYEDMKAMKVETNRIINNHYDNIRKNYEYGFYPNTDLDKYLSENCKVSDFRDYKSWKECNQSKLKIQMIR